VKLLWSFYEALPESTNTYNRVSMQTWIICRSGYAETISPDLSALRSAWFEEYQYWSFTSSRLTIQGEKTTVWERRWSVTFPKDMLSQRCISHREIVLILAIRVSTSAEKIIGLFK
jgi:hypothetical protein